MQDDQTIDAGPREGLKQAKMYDNPNALVAEQEEDEPSNYNTRLGRPKGWWTVIGASSCVRETIEDLMCGEQVGPE